MPNKVFGAFGTNLIGNAQALSVRIGLGAVHVKIAPSKFIRHTSFYNMTDNAGIW